MHCLRVWANNKWSANASASSAVYILHCSLDKLVTLIRPLQLECWLSCTSIPIGSRPNVFLVESRGTPLKQTMETWFLYAFRMEIHWINIIMFLMIKPTNIEYIILFIIHFCGFDIGFVAQELKKKQSLCSWRHAKTFSPLSHEIILVLFSSRETTRH